MELLAEDIGKSYGPVKALADIHLKVSSGERFGLIGPDGAGKTSLFRIFATLLIPDQGRAQVGPYDVIRDYRQIRQITGYMPGRFSLYQDLTIAENLHFFATIFGTTLQANYDLIRDIYIQIEPFKDRRAGQLSGGMKQKLALCCALIHKPEVLLLDEPTTGVDPVSRKEFWDMLDRLQAFGITILVSTPYMDEAARCDRIALIAGGGLLRVDRPEAIREAFPYTLYQVGGADTYRLIQDLKSYPGMHSAYPFGEYIHFTSGDPGFRPDTLIGYLKEQGHRDIEVFETRPDIEDTFMELSL